MGTLIECLLPIRLYAFTLILLAANVLLCQTISTGESTGVVIDPDNKVAIGAVVKLKNTATGESSVVHSDASGIYRFPFVKPGAYELAAESQSLKSDTVTFVVAVGQVQVLDLHLKLEAARTVVQVTDAAPLLNRDNDNLVNTLSSKQLELLPLPGGDLVAVAYSTPGVVINNHEGLGNFSVQGVGSVSNLFTVNGIDDMDPYWNVNNSGTTGLLLGANEIQEASVIQDAFEGQYGRQAGAQVNYVTKSGTNFYHGNLSYSYNSDLLNANDFFANATGAPRPRELAHQYAASFGGPVIRDKLFFFIDTEGDRLVQPFGSTVVAIPSPAMQSYTLKTIQPSQIPFYEAMFNLYNHAPGVERAVPVTNGNGPLQDSSGNLGCGRLAGTPTGAGGGAGTLTGTGSIFGVNVPCAVAWGSSSSVLTSEWLLSTRMDYNLSVNQKVFFRYKTDHGYVPVNVSYINPLFTGITRRPDYEGQVHDTFAIKPSLVNNFIGSVTYNNFDFSTPDLGAALRLFPFRIALNDGGANGGRIAPLGPPQAVPFGRRATQYQVVDDVSYAFGRHFFRAGVNYRFNPEADLEAANIEVGKFSIFGMDVFANGVLPGGDGPNRFSQTFNANPVFHIRLYNVGGYVQDQWAATSRLKLTATLRLERTGNPYCVNGCFARFTQPFAELSKGPSIPYDQSIQADQRHAFYAIEPVIPEPRFGLAYSPSWLRNTVLHAGVGLFSDLYPAFFAGNQGQNAPNVFVPVIRTGLIDYGGPEAAPAIATASANAFQSGFAAGDTLMQIQQAVAPSPFEPPLYYSFPRKLRSPKSLQWNLDVQRQIGNKNVLTLRYMGNHGYDVFVINPNANASANPLLYPNGFAGLPAQTPDPRFSVVQQLSNSGYSNYNALLITFRRALANGVQGQVSYTWSHALDTVSNGGLVAFNPFDSVMGQIDPFSLRRLNYSNADYDNRHNVTAEFIWEMPTKFRNALMQKIVGGWSVGSTLSAHTGTPFSVTNNSAVPSASFGGVVMADVIDPSVNKTCGRAAVNTPCFMASQFAPSATAPPFTTQADFGNMRRNSFRGPGYFNLDSTLFKTVPISERIRLTIGVSAYDLLNHPNFANPRSDIAFQGLGLITSTTTNPSSPYGIYGGPSGRAVVLNSRLLF